MSSAEDHESQYRHLQDAAARAVADWPKWKQNATQVEVCPRCRRKAPDFQNKGCLHCGAVPGESYHDDRFGH